MERVLHELEEVRKELEELNRKWVVSDPFPKSSFHKVLKIAVVITLMGITWEHITITKCFLVPNQTGWSARSCAVLYPGYSKARSQSRENLEQFDQLIKNSQDIELRLKQLEQEVNK